MARRRQPIRDHTAEANLFARRAVIAGLLVVMMMGGVFVNLANLQIRHHQDYQTRSNENRIKVLPVAPNRGLIYDRNGVLLAENRPVYSLEIIPEKVNDLEQTLVELQQLMTLSDAEVEDFRAQRKGTRRFKPVPVRNQLDHLDVALFAANQHKFPGVQISARLARYYPYKDSLTHLLGYVSRINKKDAERLEQEGSSANYAASHYIGKQGIERYYESILHGQVGYQQVEVNNQGRIIRILDFEPPIPGQDLVLNIDIRIQERVAEALSERRGAIIVSEPSSGAILAMYSGPSYDPNLFVHGISQKDYSSLLNSRYSPLLNRATQGRYPPASTIKPHLALVGLEKGVVAREKKIVDRGRFTLPNVSHVWRDWKKWGHGSVDVKKAIEVSCDTYFYELAYKLGIDRIHEGMTAFGFGEYTGIDLREESNALMPSRGWKRARFNEPWYIGDTIPVGIGQSFWNATPMQILNSINILVNKGFKIKPSILQGVMIENEIAQRAAEREQVIDVVDPINWDLILASLYGTVNEPHGTAREAFKDAEYKSAGKTGTAQLFTVAQDAEYDEENVDKYLRDNAMYVGYAPFDAPEISVVVAIENAGGGGSNAAPAAREIMDFYFGLKSQYIAQTGEDDETVLSSNNE